MVIETYESAVGGFGLRLYRQVVHVVSESGRGWLVSFDRCSDRAPAVGITSVPAVEPPQRDTQRVVNATQIQSGRE